MVERSGQDLGKFSLLGSLTTSREGQTIGKIFYMSTVLKEWSPPVFHHQGTDNDKMLTGDWWMRI